MSIAVGVIDYGQGNKGSILNMLKRIGVTSGVVSSPADLRCAERLILPGVGAFDSGVQALKASGLWNVILEEALVRRKPLLGVCLGMQLLCDGSEEGSDAGLSIVPGRCLRFPDSSDPNLRVPNMGWAEIQPSACIGLFEGFDPFRPWRFYFTHSFYFRPEDRSAVAATARYGLDYAAAIHKDNIFGVQFHPEKSHRFGVSLLRNFSKISL